MHAGGARHAGRQEGRHVGGPARAGELAVHAVPARPPAHARALAGPQRTRRGRLRRRHPRGARRDPARLPDADLRLRGHLPGPDDRGPQGPRRDRPPEQPADVRQQRPPPRGLRARGPRRASDGRDQAGREVRLLVPERPGRGVPLVPRPRARPHGADALLRAARRLHPPRRARGGARPAARRLRRPAHPGRPRVQQGRLVPLRGERGRRAPRRHDPRQRRRRAAHARGAPHLPAALPQRVQRAVLRAAPRAGTQGRAGRERRRPAGAARDPHERAAPSGRAGRAARRLPPVPAGVGDRAPQRPQRAPCRAPGP